MMMMKSLKAKQYSYKVKKEQMNLFENSNKLFIFLINIC